MGARESGAADPRTVAVCFVAALMEGADIQSMGVALPRLVPAFHLDPSQAGLAASASVLGMMIGAAIGGWFADRIGRRKVLIASMILLGIFSLATAAASTLVPLVAVRLLTGLGLGGAFPSLIALSGEAAPARRRSIAIALMYCGMPIGGTLAAATGVISDDWRTVFYLGGFGPLLVVGLILALTRETGVHATATGSPAKPPLGKVLFGEGRGPATLMLWASYFFTLLVLSLLLNWLPSLLIGRGLTRPQALSAAMILNVGGVIGSVVFGLLMDKGRGRGAGVAVYLGMALSLIVLAALSSPGPLFAAALATGFFVIGGQLLLYALAPDYYPFQVRATGVGAAVAAGRLGSLTGPLAGGMLLAGGGGAATVLGATVPGMAVALLAVLAVQFRPRAD